MRDTTLRLGPALTALTLAGLAVGVLMLVLTAAPALADPGTTYYVDDDTGNDARTPAQAQSQVTPWKTISHAVATVPAGSPGDPNIIQVAGGLYDTTNNGEAFPITFTKPHVKLVGAGAGTTIVDGEGTTDIIHIAADDITMEGLTLENASDDGVEATLGGFTITHNTFITVDQGVDVDVDEILASGYVFSDVTVISNTFHVASTGVYVDVEVDGDGTTGSTVDIGDIDVLSNTFTMQPGGHGVDVEDIVVVDLEGGEVTVGDVTISHNQFNSGSHGVQFSGSFETFSGTLITVGDVTVAHNAFQDQSSYAVDMDYYWATKWQGTTAGTFGDLSIDDNDIASEETFVSGIYVYVGFWDEFDDSASLIVGDQSIDGNDVGVDREAVYVYYEYVDLLHDTSCVTAGDLSIAGNALTSTDYCGIFLEYYEVGYEMYDSATATLGDVHITDNVVTSNDDNGVYVYYDEVGYEMDGSSTVTMGDLHVEDNEVDSPDEAIYLEYYDVGYVMTDSAALTIGAVYVMSNVVTSTGDIGVYLEYPIAADEMNGSSTVAVGDLHVEHNEVYAEYEGVYLNPYEFGYDIHDWATVSWGDQYIVDNVISSTEGVGIYVYPEYICCGYTDPYVSDHAAVTVGELHVERNRVDAYDHGLHIEFEDVAYEMYDYATLVISDTYVISNDVASTTGSGVYVDYPASDAGSYMYDNASAVLPSYTIISNTFDVAVDGVVLRTDSNPYDISGNASVDFGGFLIDHNTFSCDYGVFFSIVDVCSSYHAGEGCNDSSSAVFGDFEITNNHFEDLVEDAVHIAFDGVCDTFDDDATVGFGDMVVAGNVISGAQNGVYVGYGDIQAEYSATVSMGALDITGNDISNVLGDGVYLTYALSAAHTSSVTVGRALVELNDISFCGDDGVDLDDISILSDTNALATLGDPVVRCNNIFSNTDYGAENDASGHLLDAEDNWWGDASGPSGNGPGTGDGVSAGVDFDPWLTALLVDADGDGFYPAPCGGDCDDDDPNEFPGQTWYKDADGDGYSDGTALVQCERPAGYKLADELLAASGDCDDGNPDVNPGATEVLCNALDDDCNAATLDSPDGDGDNYGVCEDCDDGDPAINPGAAEICDDGIDNDCDDLVDGEDPDCMSKPVGGLTRPANLLPWLALLAGLALGPLIYSRALARRQRLSQ